MLSIQTRFIWVWLLLIASVLISCSPGSTPPGASSIGGVVDGGSYSYHYWEEGLAILIWQDTSYGSGESCSGTGSTEDPVYKLECTVNGPEGQNYSWRVHTTDGMTGEMWIEDQPVDLSKGAMFLVNVGEDSVQFEQLQRDLSALERSNEAIAALAESDPDVATFIATSETGGDSSDVDDEHDLNKEYGLAEFTDALLMDGQSVDFGGPVNQPFFSVPGQVVVVNGEDVQVFEFSDSAAAAADSAQISPDAASVGTSMMTWMATPHFYAQERLIVLYVGDDQVVVDALTAELGQPIAEGQGMPPLPPPDAATLLSDAFAAADYEALRGLMGESLNIGYWLSEGQTLTPEQADEQLRLLLLPDPASVSFIRDRALFPDLGNMDPAAAFGPDAQIVDLVFSQGWGIDGRGEAILTIAQGADGSQYWQGIIYASAGFALPPGPLKTTSLLSHAIATADYEALQALMGETFAIGYWLSEGQRLTPSEAIEQLRLNLLPNPAAVSFIRDRNQFPDLGDVDPVAIFGPDVQIVELIYSQGWGIDGSDEAILAIAQNADGSQYWHGMLSGRFDQFTVPPVQEPTSDETTIYRNLENGFELDYPASWHLDEQVLGSRASGALFYAAETDAEPIFSAVIYLWDPKNDLDAWLEQLRQSWSGSNAAVLSEEELTLAGGQRAVKFELLWLGGQMTNHLLMEIGDRYLELASPGDPGAFDEIIGSLRFVESGS